MEEAQTKKWYGGVSPTDLTAKGFCKLHHTGYIPSPAYERYEETGGLAWLGKPEKYAILRETRQHGNLTVEYRMKDEWLDYVKIDADGEIVRGRDGMALMMSMDEKKAAGLALKDQTIVAFVGDEPVGHVSNELGAVGVWVEARVQKKGIGSRLLVSYLLDNPTSQIGQMTNAGENMVCAAHKQLCEAIEPAGLPGKTSGDVGHQKKRGVVEIVD